MGDNILKIALAELDKLRVVCPCGCVIEHRIDEIGRLDGSQCPACCKPLGVDRGKKFTALQNALRDLQNGATSIEFPIHIDRLKPTT